MEQRCRKHPNHKQSRGVCASCLRERLYHLSASSSASTNASSSPFSSGSMSDSVTSATSPRSTSQRRKAKKTVAVMAPLKKSRSMACVLGISTEGEGIGMKGDGMGRRKKRDGGRGFWSRLLPGKERKRKEEQKKGVVILHSKTLNETSSSSSSRWIF